MADNLETLIVDIKQSLECQMKAGFAEINARCDDLNARFDAEAARMEHENAFLQTLYTATASMAEWSN